MVDFARYYRDREPCWVFQIHGFDRTFLAYTPLIVADVRAALREGQRLSFVYKALCARALAGDPAIAALPRGTPMWTRVQGRWRPRAEAGGD